jgi:CBS domain containing-hemolysin-like protein
VSAAVPPDPATNRDALEQTPDPQTPAREEESSTLSADSWLARAIRTMLGWRSGSLRADLEAVLDASTPEEAGFTAAERAMLRNILDLRERRIADVMVQRADIIAVRQDIPLGDLMKLFESAAHSRLVVYRETLDDPEGMVHIRDLLAYITSRSQVDPDANTRRKKPLPANLDLRSIDLMMPLEHAGIIRKLLFVPPSMPAIDLLAKMQTARVHLALVIDEYGGTDGLVSIEDLVEQIVGEIDDEHDDDTPPSIVKQPDNSFIADARAPLEDVITMIGPSFEFGETSSAVDTLGGYLVAQVGRMPERGEVISGPGVFEIEVLDADPRRLKRLRISLRKELPAPRVRAQRRRTPASDAAPAAITPESLEMKPAGGDKSAKDPVGKS